MRLLLILFLGVAHGQHCDVDGTYSSVSTVSANETTQGVFNIDAVIFSGYECGQSTQEMTVTLQRPNVTETAVVPWNVTYTNTTHAYGTEFAEGDGCDVVVMWKSTAETFVYRLPSCVAPMSTFEDPFQLEFNFARVLSPTPPTDAPPSSSGLSEVDIVIIVLCSVTFVSVAVGLTVTYVNRKA